MNIDWNVVIHILDELSDGTHSFLELSYTGSHYAREPFLDGLLFLADRGLIGGSVGRENYTSVPRSDWPGTLRAGFGVDRPDPVMMVATSVDLTDKGEQVLRLLNIGHAPLSSAEHG